MGTVTINSIFRCSHWFEPAHHTRASSSGTRVLTVQVPFFFSFSFFFGPLLWYGWFGWFGCTRAGDLLYISYDIIVYQHSNIRLISYGAYPSLAQRAFFFPPFSSYSKVAKIHPTLVAGRHDAEFDTSRTLAFVLCHRPNFSTDTHTHTLSLSLLC